VEPSNAEAVASGLHENERKILLVLREAESATTSELGAATGLNRDAIEKACAWAETKGVLDIEEEVSRTFHLTDEGLRYAAEGLPEKRLLRLVRGGENELVRLKGTFQALDIALVWIRRNEWATIKGGRLALTQKGLEELEKETIDERLLYKLSEAQLDEDQLDDASGHRISLLLRRGLIGRTETTEKKARITDFGRSVVPYLEAEAKAEFITQVTPEHLRHGGWRGAAFQRYDVSLPVPKLYPGKRHFISQVIDYIRRFWVEMGFKEMKGPMLELAFWNFDALFQPQDHPARDLADTFYMRTPHSGRLPNPELVRRVKETHENGWTTGSTGWQYAWDEEFASRCCLRTHTTSLSVNAIAKLRKEDMPAKFFSVGRVFRNETIDWNHLAEFYQTDGIVVGEGVTFRHMLGYLKEYLERLGMKRFRFRPGYFPYTEMSLEAEVWIEEKQSWMELFGAGMFRPEVVKPLLGVDVPVLAWGPGFDRIVMRHYGINNIRTLYSNDVGQLREAPIWVE